MSWTLMLHGGSGAMRPTTLSPEHESRARAGLNAALDAGEAVLTGGGLLIAKEGVEAIDGGGADELHGAGAVEDEGEFCFHLELGNGDWLRAGSSGHGKASMTRAGMTRSEQSTGGRTGSLTRRTNYGLIIHVNRFFSLSLKTSDKRGIFN